MSDSELSDINNDDDLIREYERKSDEADEAGNEVKANVEGGEDRDQENNGYVSNEEVKPEDESEKKDSHSEKKRVSRKMFVLNTARLKSQKGIHTIEKVYEGFKFKGKGREKEDLDRVMKKLEYWAFRLFPKLDFDDFLDKCEHLGHKKDLQTHLKKYRLGMITADDICAENDIIDDKDDEVIMMEKEPHNEITNDDFQRLFDEHQQTTI